MSGENQPWAQGNFNDGITPVADPTPGTSLEDETLHSRAVTAGGGHSRCTLETPQPGSLEGAHQHSPGACGPIIEQASEDVLAIADEFCDESSPVEKLGTDELTSMFGLNLSASCKRKQINVPAYEVTSEETRKALKLIRSPVEANPNAFGIALIVSNQNVHPKIAYIPSLSEKQNKCQKRLNSLHGIENGAQQLEEAFTMRGLTVIRLENPTKKQLFSVIRAMALDRTDPMAIEYPASYRYFFFYTTGYGANHVFFTKDGSVLYQEVYDLYQSFLHQRYFFFDCCRSIRLDSQSMYPNGDHIMPPCPDFPLSNNRVIFATLSGHQACGPQGEGVSFMTKKMVALLKKQIPMDKVLARLHEELPKEVMEKTGQTQQVMNVDSTPTRIDLWQEQKQAMNPTLQVSRLSSDSAVIHLRAKLPTPVTSSNCHERNTLDFQIKSLSGSWETLSEHQKVSTPVNVPQPADATSIASASSVALQEGESGHVLVSSDHSNNNQQAAANGSQRTVSCALIIPVTEVEKRTAKFRVVAELNGGLILESNSVDEEIDLARPVISERDTVIEFKGGHEVRVTISWSIRLPLTIPYHHFIIHVYKKAERIHSEEDVEPTKRHYEEFFDLPGHTDGDTYSVVVEAQRVDGQSVHSDCTPLKASKGCCYRFSWRCLVGLAVFILFCIVIIALVSSLIGTNASNINEHRYNASAMLSYTAFGIPMAQMNASFSNCLLHLDYGNQQVTKNKSVAAALYCGQFTKFQLANSQTSKFWGPNDIEINQRNKELEVPVDFLPIGSTIPTGIDLLPRSVFSVYLCLSAPVDGTIILQLYRYEDSLHLATSEPLQRTVVTFENSTACNYSSNTSISIVEPNLVIGALSTNSTVHPEFTMIQGYVQQYYYDKKYLGLINDSYLVEDEPKTIPGSSETDLVCYVDGGRRRTVFLQPFSVLVPTAWTVWTVIVTAIVLLLLVVIYFLFIFRRSLVRCYCCVCNQCRQKCGPFSYMKLN